jgi:hypothetical protein
LGINVAENSKKKLGKVRNHRSLAEGKSKSGAEGEVLNYLKKVALFFRFLLNLFDVIN